MINNGRGILETLEDKIIRLEEDVRILKDNLFYIEGKLPVLEANIKKVKDVDSTVIKYYLDKLREDVNSE